MKVEKVVGLAALLAAVAAASSLFGVRYAARRIGYHEADWSDLWMERGAWLDNAFRADQRGQAGERSEWNAGFAEGLREASDGFLSVADPGETVLRISERALKEKGYL